MNVNVNGNTDTASQAAAAVAMTHPGGARRGAAGGSRGITGDGFAQIFMQLMNGGTEGAGQALLASLGLTAEEETPGDKGAGQWDMLTAMLEAAAQNTGFRQFALADLLAAGVGVSGANPAAGGGGAESLAAVQGLTGGVSDTGLAALMAAAGGGRAESPAAVQSLAGGGVSDAGLAALTAAAGGGAESPAAVQGLTGDSAASALTGLPGFTALTEQQQQALFSDPAVQSLFREAAAAAALAGQEKGISGRTALTAAGEGTKDGGGPAGTLSGLAEALAGGGKTLSVTAAGDEGQGRSGAGRELFLGQEQFRQAVQAARNRLAGKEAEGTEAARAALNAQTAFRALAAQYAGTPEAVSAEEPGIPQQIFDGLSKNLAAGKGEFVVKLMPEGLGEITVKLLEAEGKTTLRIITASSETAKLINDNINALRDALRPIQVEVREAVPETKPEAGSEGYRQEYAQFSQFNQFEQFNQSGRRAGQDQSVDGAGRRARLAEELREEALTEPVQGTLAGQDLDMYI